MSLLKERKTLVSQTLHCCSHESLDYYESVKVLFLWFPGTDSRERALLPLQPISVRQHHWHTLPIAIFTVSYLPCQVKNRKVAEK